MKAQTLPEVIRVFDPMHPLIGEELKTWYIDRPGNPLERMKIYLQGLGLANAPVKLLFTGHVGSGKSTTRNKLAEEIKRQFFIVSFDARQSLSMAGLSREDYPILYERYQDKLVSADEAVLSLLQTRPLLEYANGDPWCDVHPIALPLVLERIGRLPAVSPQP